MHFNVNHPPAGGITYSLDWEASLGQLDYLRRVYCRFARKIDVAKGYRQYLIDRGEFSTLAERAAETPVLKRFFKGFEYHWVHSDLDRSEEAELVLANIQRFQQAGVPISFFYPKWPAKEYSSMEANSANWQAVFLDEPAPGGWPVQVKQLEQIRQLGCAIKIMINLHNYDPQAPGFDPVKSRG